MSQAEFAQAVRAAGRRLGEPNRCSKRLAQKWLSGEHAMPTPEYQRALAHVTGLSIEVLCSPIVPPDRGEAAERLASIIGSVVCVADALVDVSILLDPASSTEEVDAARARRHPPPRLVGARLSDARKEAGYSQRELAEEIRLVARMALGVVVGCSKRLVQKWELEEHSMPLPQYRATLEDIFDISFLKFCEPLPLEGPEQVVKVLRNLADTLRQSCTQLGDFCSDLDYGS